MEVLDLYDNKKQKLNKTIVRSEGEPQDGEYNLSVHAWLLRWNRIINIKYEKSLDEKYSLHVRNNLTFRDTCMSDFLSFKI